MRLLFTIPSRESICQFGLFVGKFSMYFRIRGPEPFQYWPKEEERYLSLENIKKLIIVRFGTIDEPYDWGIKRIA